jgi:hypothetical protein
MKSIFILGMWIGFCGAVSSQLMLLTAGQSITAGKKEQIVVLDVLINVGNSSEITSAEPTEFCGKKMIVPYMQRVLMVQNMVLAFQHPGDLNVQQTGSTPVPYVALPATFPSGTTICVPRYHHTAGVLVYKEQEED